jgi:hypothetical protein
MAQPAQLPPVTEDAFTADRQKFWGEFGGFVTASVIGVVILLVLMLIFLV